MAVGASLGAFGTAMCALSGATSIEVSGATIRLGDVVTPACLAGDESRGELQLARIASRSTTMSLTREALAALVRRRVPALASIDLAGAPGDHVRLHVVGGDQARETQPCYVATAAIPEGGAIRADDVSRSVCAGRPLTGQLRYDRLSRLTRAARDIGAGDNLGPIMAPPAILADTGEVLQLVVTMGAVRIEREVEVVQSSTSGAVFVRDEEGHVFSAPLAAERAQ
jgi:hypothetical protein